jgi:hypothetical protein
MKTLANVTLSPLIIIKNLLGLTVVLMMVVIRPYSEVNASFGVSGTFAGYHYKIVPGERIDSENIYASFVNNYSVPIDVQIATEGPAGVEFLVEQGVVTIPAGRKHSSPNWLSVIRRS